MPAVNSQEKRVQTHGLQIAVKGNTSDMKSAEQSLRCIHVGYLSDGVTDQVDMMARTMIGVWPCESGRGCNVRPPTSELLAGEVYSPKEQLLFFFHLDHACRGWVLKRE